MDEAAWVKLWHPRGIEVRLPLLCDAVIAEDGWKFALKSIDNALAAGWLATAPGLVAGEEKLVVALIARRVQTNHDGSETDVLDLYPESDVLTYASVSVYLNKPEDVAAFERASNMLVANMQTYVGSGKIQRGKSKHTDALLHKPPHRLLAIVKPNPKYDAADTEVKRPKLLFDRWHLPHSSSDSQAAPTAPTGTAATVAWPQGTITTPRPDPNGLATLRSWLQLPDAKVLDKFNGIALADFKRLAENHPDRKARWSLLVQHAGDQGWFFNPATRTFTIKPPPAAELEIPF